MDELPGDHPGAMQSRRDLLRINACMGNARIMARALKQQFSRHLSFRMAELGAGDGEFMLRVAQRLRRMWRGVDTTLIDQHDLLRPDTRTRFEEVKWRVRSERTNVFEWLKTATGPLDAITANLFLHHFSEEDLRVLLRQVAARTRFFVAIEPRRSRTVLFFSRCLWAIGCNPVTRHDAPASVRAGFAGHELMALWPDHERWELTEHPAGFFSHVFIARRREKVESAVVHPVISAVFQRGEAMASTQPTLNVPDSSGARRHD